MAKKSNDSSSNGRKKPVSQADIPRYSLKQAIRIAEALAEHYASAPTKPMHVASAINMTMNSSTFRVLAGSSSSYGLSTGAWDSPTISLTPLGRQAVSGKTEDEKRAALREAFLRPRIIGQFMRRYNNSKMPAEKAAANVLQELGLPTDATSDAFQLISKGAAELGLLHTAKGSQFVDLDGVPTATKPTDVSDDQGNGKADDVPPSDDAPPTRSAATGAVVTGPVVVPTALNNRVFITHGKNLAIVSQLKDLLTFGNFSPVVAAENETVSKPVPDKVMDDMRSCAAAIIHVGKEIKLLDAEGKEHIFINQNVLIEIGAAMALYGRKFILLVERGANLPSNLQGLYEVRYEGEKLDYDATIKLLRAFNDFKL